jgi:NTE family protein
MHMALHECKIEPDLLVGTSVGAVNATHLAGPGSTRARLEALVRLWQRMRRRDVFAPDPRRWLGAARGAQPSLFAGTGLQRLPLSNLGYDDLDDARVPVEVTATDLVTGEGIVIGTGAAVSAVRASAAVPGLLPAVVRQGRTLVDGALGELEVLALHHHGGRRAREGTSA